MGLTTWASSPDGKILPSDITIGKNYFTRDELNDLGRLVNAFLDLNDRQILDGAGRISKTQINACSERIREIPHYPSPGVCEWSEGLSGKWCKWLYRL
jgi:hypothetical protein